MKYVGLNVGLGLEGLDSNHKAYWTALGWSFSPTLATPSQGCGEEPCKVPQAPRTKDVYKQEGGGKNQVISTILSQVNYF